MSVSNVSGGAYAYLQSLLQQQEQSNSDGGPVDPITALLNAFYPSGWGSTAASTASGTAAPDAAVGSAPGSCGNAQFSPDTLGAMIDWQSRQSGLSQKVDQVFTEFDANGDGGIDKSEFENAFGSNADMSKVDGLFNTLDADGNGSISESELTSAAQQSQAQHHHHHHHHMGGSGGSEGAGGTGGPLASLMSAIGGASSSTTNNPDGSSTTTITYADGSSVTLSTPAPSSQQTSSDGSGSQDPTFNFLEQLIQLQANLLADSANNQPPAVPLVGSKTG